ncbi:MAG: hypothetical protein IKM99_05740 [Bacteroidales bacterium]|nr:hypothetical protein [Bacteroidales bacterium]
MLVLLHQTTHYSSMKKYKPFLATLLLLTAFFMATRCKPEDGPIPGGDSSDIINPNYVPIDWNQANLLASNDSTGLYQIQFTGEMPEITPGSIITIDQDTAVRYVFVESTTVDGKTVSLTSIQAYLTDIFANTDITLTTIENTKKSAAKTFYPTAVFLQGDDGTFQKTDLKRANDDGFGFTQYLWNFNLDYNNTELLSVTDYFSVEMRKLLFNFDLGVEMYMNFGGRDIHEITENLVDRYRSQALNINGYLVGTFHSEMETTCGISNEIEYDNGYEIWKHNPVKTPRIRFIVYGVPVVIQINSDLYRHVTLSAEGEIAATIGFKDDAEGRLGFEWQQGNGITPVSTFSNTFEFMEPAIEGSAEVKSSFWVFPRFRLVLYDMLGPSIDVMPFLSTSLSGGFHKDLIGQGNNDCAWSLDCNTGVDFRAGLSFQFMGYEIENLLTDKVNLVNKTLYHAPQKIEHQEKGSVSIGKNNTIEFTVYDRNYLLDTDVITPLEQYMRFEASGDLSSHYGILRDGKVTVDWTPSQGDILYSKLYDTNGNVLACDTVRATEEGDWVDLGLPSGTLWATHNVGATAPEEYGDYFAWAEVQPKEVYNWDTYQYGNQESGLTKYCTNPNCGYNGFADNLTILLPEDDAATVNWGEEWCTPDNSQLWELMHNTNYQWTTMNGVNGGLFTAANGKSIFLPAAGTRMGPSGVYGGNEIGNYWSCNLHPDTPFMPTYFAFHVGNNSFPYQRCNGAPIRPVRSATRH